MALPFFPTILILSVFYELSLSVLEINVFDAMATFYCYVEKQWVQAMEPKMLSANGNFRRTKSAKSRVSIALSANELVENDLIAGFFKAEKLESLINWRQITWSRAYQESTGEKCQASDKFISEAE